MEREIELQIAGHWVIFALIIGIVLSMVGVTGTVIGLAYAPPSEAIAHPVLHPLAKVSVIVGPIVLFGGAVMLAGSVFGIYGQRNAPTRPKATTRYKGFRPMAHKNLNEYEYEGEEEMTGSGMDLHGLYSKSSDGQEMSGNA